MNTEAKLFTKAEKIYFKHSETRYIPAINAFKNLLDQYPKNIEGWLMMAIMQSGIDDYDGALNSYNKAIECDPTKIESIEQKLTQLSLLNHMDYSAPYFIDTTNKRRYKIKAIPSPIELAELMIETIDKHLMLLPDNDKAYKLIKDKAEQLYILGKTEEAIKTYQKALEAITKDKKQRFFLFNPVNSIYRDLSKLYADLQEYDLALKYFELSVKDEEPTPSQLRKADILIALGKSNLATQTANQFIEYLDQKLAKEPETAYFNQKIGALLWLKDFDGARATIYEFDVLKPFNDYITNNIRKAIEEIESAEEIHLFPKSAHKFKNLKSRILDQDEIKSFYFQDQAANELIAWFHEMGEHHTHEKLLIGIGKVIAAMKNNPEFPIAEYNNLRDVTNLLGLCYGEILKNEFNWNWYYIEESQKGCVGYIIVSPDEKIGILVEEYFYTRVFTNNNEDYITLYEDLKNGIQFQWSEIEFKVLGNWKHPVSYEQITNEI